MSSSPWCRLYLLLWSRYVSIHITLHYIFLLHLKWFDVLSCVFVVLDYKKVKLRTNYVNFCFFFGLQSKRKNLSLFPLGKFLCVWCSWKSIIFYARSTAAWDELREQVPYKTWSVCTTEQCLGNVNVLQCLQTFSLYITCIFQLGFW